jgi:flagellar basal-body rod modification protein FlgD
MITGVPPSVLEQYGPNPAAAAPPPSSGEAISQTEFLTLFVAQLQHQDPLSPLEPNELTAQLAQFASLEQLTAVNSRLDTLATVSRDGNASALLGLIGKRVTVDGGTLPLAGGEAAPVRYTLAEAAAEVTATVRAPDGQVVRVIELGAQEVGPHEFEFDGENANGGPLADGVYSLEVTARAADATVPTAVALLTDATIEGVDFSTEPPVLLAGTQRFSLDQVKQVHAPEP